MIRTLKIVTDYNGQLDATLIANCMIGLLILPKEKLTIKYPKLDNVLPEDWGIDNSMIINHGNCDHGHQHRLTTKQLLRRLRNSVAHANFNPIHENGLVRGFEFKDRNGFHAKIPLTTMLLFFQKLAEYISIKNY